ncbi:MAG: hypothetical protein OEV85_11645 [Candidatus Thorarchaeota archaeon]|nr:hypothetical protein [Candidatus Thorarchaeota archaeon]
MRLRFREDETPYPIAIVKGRLRLSGLTDQETSSIIEGSLLETSTPDTWTEDDLIRSIEGLLEKHSRKIRDNFRLLTTYEQFRGKTNSTPSLILALEGASATGKSMLAIELVQDLAATRFISTDTIRQVLRGVYDRQSHPELFCHTYQAYKHKQSGDSSLDPIVRGYIAQSEMLKSHIQDLAKRVNEEGAISVFEGVHLRPGILKGINTNVLEIVINPTLNTHRSMFLSKQRAAKLRTVSNNLSVRTQEFEATRKIQEYLISQALQKKVPIIEMESYEEAKKEIYGHIINSVKSTLKKAK